MSEPKENNARSAIEGQFMALFSGNDLEVHDAISRLKDMESAPGIHSFLTPLSWTIRQSNGMEIKGNDLNLLDAVKSIVGSLQALAIDPENEGEQISLFVGKSRFTSREGDGPAMAGRAK